MHFNHLDRVEIYVAFPRRNYRLLPHTQDNDLQLGFDVLIECYSFMYLCMVHS